MSDRQDEARPGGTGDLFFLDEAVFPTEWWTSDDGQVVLHTLELDLVAKGADVDEAAQKLGELVFDLFRFLAEDDERTEVEEEILSLISSRMAPPLVKYHLERRKDEGFLGVLLRGLNRRSERTEWAQHQSTRDESERALPV